MPSPGHMPHFSIRYAIASTKAWLRGVLAVVLLLSNLMLGLHAVGHVGDGDITDCKICLLGGGLDQSITASAISQPDKTPHIHTFEVRISSAQPSPFTAFRSRAPPLGHPA